jgi:hypothetical protein
MFSGASVFGPIEAPNIESQPGYLIIGKGNLGVER